MPGTTAAAGEPQAWVWWAPGSKQTPPRILPKARLDSMLPLAAQADVTAMDRQDTAYTNNELSESAE
jgi:hypothetical protein